MAKQTVNEADKVSIETFFPNIGKKVRKTSGESKVGNPLEPKPFKSMRKVY